jgi:hypothetical protein
LGGWQSDGIASWSIMDAEQARNISNVIQGNEGIPSVVQDNAYLLLNGGWSFDETQAGGMDMNEFVTAISEIERTIEDIEFEKSGDRILVDIRNDFHDIFDVW